MAKAKKANGPVLFMVGEIDYQYNDETYYRGESETAASPIKLFKTREAAQAEAARLTIESMHGWMGDLTHFGYEPSEVFSDLEGAEVIYNRNGVEGNLKDIWENFAGGYGFQDVFKKMSAADQQALLKTLNIEFYMVSEVELAE